MHVPRDLGEGLVLRAARDDDADGVIGLVGRVFDEYPGCVLDVDAEEPELRAPASSFERFWVVARGAAVLGSIALASRPGADGRPVVELKKLYLDASLRGRGLGRVLVETLEAEARARGAARIELWTDTRFEAAHRVYERLGYARTGRERELHDLSDTREFEYVKPLA